MKDRFKFRVWSKECSEYVEQECCDCYIRYNGELEFYNLKDTDEDCIYDGYPEDDAIVEQCTGLRDKDGQLIYENDHIENDNTKDDVYLVVFDEKTARFMAKEMNGNLRLINKNVRVVGNIHEKDVDDE